MRREIKYGRYVFDSEKREEMQAHLLPLHRVDLNKSTKRVSFDSNPETEGPMTANACVEVHTSDGREGTLTHLMIGTDTKAFAKDLRNMVGKSGVPTVLMGGDSNSNESNRLMFGLRRDLSEQGFNVADTDLGGNCGRRSVLRKDSVEVEVEDYQNGSPVLRRKTLFFSK